jgi:DNA-binding MarR family transcriptional regulator
VTRQRDEQAGEIHAQDLDRLIHEPARLVLVANLYVVDEADFVFIARQTGLTAGNISSHMTRLEDAGYVTIDKTFVDKRPRTVYALTATGRAAFERYRENVTHLIADAPT